MDVRRVRRWAEEHPEWWIVLAAAAGWVMMAMIPHAEAHAADAHAGHWHAGHGGDAAAGGGAGMHALRAGVMSVAMMLPLVTANVRHAAFSRPRMRHLAIAGFAVGFLAVWTPVQMAIDAAAAALGTRAGWIGVLATAAVAAAAWELAPGQRERTHRCHATAPLRAEGWRADADCLRYGVVTGRRCVVSCWALMALCAAASHALPVMAAVFAVQWTGRDARWRTRRWAAAAVIAACAMGVGALRG